jgi:hypothetical protein
MAVKNGARLRKTSPAADQATGDSRQQSARRLSPAEVVVLEAMIAEAQEMRRQLTEQVRGR